MEPVARRRRLAVPQRSTRKTASEQRRQACQKEAAPLIQGFQINNAASREDPGSGRRSQNPIRVLGRKNYLFAGSDAGGKRAAAIYSLVETAKLNSLDPEQYLRDVLNRIADHPINKIDALLPWRIYAA